MHRNGRQRPARLLLYCSKRAKMVLAISHCFAKIYKDEDENLCTSIVHMPVGAH